MSGGISAAQLIQTSCRIKTSDTFKIPVAEIFVPISLLMIQSPYYTSMLVLTARVSFRIHETLPWNIIHYSYGFRLNHLQTNAHLPVFKGHETGLLNLIQKIALKFTRKTLLKEQTWYSTHAQNISLL